MNYNKFIIKTNKGYICEKKAIGYYELKDNQFYRSNCGSWTNSLLSSCNKVDKLGFSENKEDATIYSGCIGNRIEEILTRINYGFENITNIEIIKIN